MSGVLQLYTTKPVDMSGVLQLYTNKPVDMSGLLQLYTTKPRYIRIRMHTSSTI